MEPWEAGEHGYISPPETVVWQQSGDQSDDGHYDGSGMLRLVTTENSAGKGQSGPRFQQGRK